ncbi:cytochrome c [uncultured Shewanella sp.]|uniref:c-type cytochrome n=1 Tax=uncultured Shewanella sp. TaxID=173975 RepID=UPI00260BBE74|nr:cytochrome c [uncultured Shewanella sp.]
MPRYLFVLFSTMLICGGLVVLSLTFLNISTPFSVESQSKMQVETRLTPEGMSRGEYVAKMSDCLACHTGSPNLPYAGGLPISLPNGMTYSTNITPDKETGIGHYSLADFKRVLRAGIRRDGRYLYPAMPYTEYTKLSDADIEALYHYFMTSVPPIHQINHENDLPITMMRWTLAVWNGLFHTQGAYQIDSSQTQEWNRGAYLVQGPAHCGSCHTPRGWALQTIANNEREKGFLAGANFAGWHGFNITNDLNYGLGNWRHEQIVEYLKTGSVAGKAQAAGPMGKVIEYSLRYLTAADLNAIAVYLRDVPAVSGTGKSRFEQGNAIPQDIELRGVPIAEAKQTMPGKFLYMENCSACHDVDGSGSPDGYYPSLYHNSVVGSDNPSNLIQVILKGVHRNNNQGEILMPAFSTHLSDEQVSILVNFLTRTYGQGDGKITSKEVKVLRPFD